MLGPVGLLGGYFVVGKNVNVKPGDKIEGIGPRGKITTADGADWHLFVGDESALPAIFRMAESLPGGTQARVLLEIPGPEDEQDLRAVASTHVTWLHRAGGPAWHGT